jgi:hypothetical protein
MKRWIAVFAMGTAMLASSHVYADPQMEALIYISPQDFSHEVRLGTPPYFSRWVLKGPAVQAAAQEALSSYFSPVALCDGVSGADVLVWVKPNLSYNPGIRRYYAKLKVQFHSGNGKQVAVYKAMGEQDGAIGSVYADDDVRKAFDAGMRQIMQQFQADANAQQALAAAKAANPTKAPCALIGAIPNPGGAE